MNFTIALCNIFFMQFIAAMLNITLIRLRINTFGTKLLFFIPAKMFADNAPRIFTMSISGSYIINFIMGFYLASVLFTCTRGFLMSLIINAINNSDEK